MPEVQRLGRRVRYRVRRLKILQNRVLISDHLTYFSHEHHKLLYCLAESDDLALLIIFFFTIPYQVTSQSKRGKKLS